MERHADLRVSQGRGQNKCFRIRGLRCNHVTKAYDYTCMERTRKPDDIYNEKMISQCDDKPI